MKFDVRYANHPDDSALYDTEELREKYLIEKLFEADDILLTYSHQDRIIAGGAMPVKKTLSLGTFKELAAYAKEVGAFIGMEGAAGHVCWNVATLKRAIDEINADNIKVIFDIYNYLDASNYQNYLEILDEGLKTFKNIVVFHIKDCVFEDGKLKQVAPGKGMFDFDKILSKIIAYDKNANLVLEGTTGDDIIPCIEFINKKWSEV